MTCLSRRLRPVPPPAGGSPFPEDMEREEGRETEKRANLRALSPCGAELAPKEDLAGRVARMEAVLLEQNGLLRELVAMLGNQRITRSQESAIKKGIRARAEEIRIREGLPERADRLIAGEIRKTLRETTGCRAVGDIPVRVFDRALAQITAWNMAGAIRRIRRAFNG